MCTKEKRIQGGGEPANVLGELRVMINPLQPGRLSAGAA
jgi:hypothetical protein